jgi:hypothetical protein
MSRVSKIVLMVAVVVLIGAGAAIAQTTTSQKLEGTVVHVYGNNLVVKMADGTIKEFNPPEGTTFNIDGVEVPVSQLKPGTKLSATITTTQVPHVVVTEEVRRGTVVERVGGTVIVRREDGTIKKFVNIPPEVKFTVDGKEVSVYDLKKGMNLTATIVSESTEFVSETDVERAGSAPAAPAPAPVAKAAPVAAPAPAPAPAPAVLPSTASQLPLVGLSGLALLVLGLGLAIIRRF